MTTRMHPQGELATQVLRPIRLFPMSPGAVTPGLVFSRDHNWIVERLVEGNQNGQFKRRERLNEEERTSQDHALFKLDRNVNCLWFAEVIIHEDIRDSFNVSRTTWTRSLVPTGETKPFIGGTVPAVPGTMRQQSPTRSIAHACGCQPGIPSGLKAKSASGPPSRLTRSVDVFLIFGRAHRS
ncbi:hypothetical protein JCM10908_000978 [Rhodotorula pacifica]|uniref:uncharacterized protein n=1 Tax=Rhodotorula pacifica TaxID=1495444 RepID=UPI0031797718